MKYKIKYEQANKRRTWHTNNPEQSRLNQMNATRSSQRYSHERKRLLLHNVKTYLPSNFTYEQLIDFIAANRYNNKRGKRKLNESFIRRLKRYGWLSYDCYTGLWINNTITDNESKEKEQTEEN